MRVRAGLCLALLACAGVGCSPSEAERPNVLLVVLDTVRADRLTPYGAPPDRTPRLAAFAADAVLFEQPIAPSSWTLPSFASLLTGRLPSRHGSGRGVDVRNLDGTLRPLDGTLWTLPERLRDAGYRTAAFVNNPFLHPRVGLDRGFDRYDHAPTDNRRLRRADVMTDLTLDWIEARGEAPWFALVHYFDPHLDYDPPPDVRGRFTSGYQGRLRHPIRQLDELRERAGTLDEADRAFVRGAYDEELHFVDRELGRLLDALEGPSRGRDTIVVITSDHGEELFDHGGFEHGHALYQEIVRVPLLVRAPGLEPRRVATPVGVIDVAATLLDALGLEVPSGGEGRSLWPALRAAREPGARPVVSEGVLYGPPRRSLVDWPYKLIATEGVAHAALYRLDRDPGETVDQGLSESARARDLLSRLDQRLARAAAGGSEVPPVVVPPETQERLRALGYVD